jgi:hypothetical protein
LHFPLDVILFFEEHGNSKRKKVLLSIQQKREALKRLDKSDNEDNDAGTGLGLDKMRE